MSLRLNTSKPNTKRVEITEVFEKTAQSDKQIVVNIGGAGSSKSHSIAQLIIQKLTNEPKKIIGVGRKTFPALRMTAYKLIVDLLKDYGIYEKNNHNKTSNVYSHPNGSSIQFFSLDNTEKIKSANFNYIWLEEANEFSYDDFLILKMRLRAPTSKDHPNKIYLSLNPVDENCWIAKSLSNDGVEWVRSTYHDNPFLTDDYTAILENLINEDENFYRIYTLGEWGRLENVIFKNYDIVDTIPREFERCAYGLDFGYVNPTVLIKIGIIGKDAYIDERIYESKMTNEDLILTLREEIRDRSIDIFADSAEPQRIEEIYRAGFSIFPANKDVKLGIDTCKRYRLKILKDSVNTIKEIRGYQRKRNKGGVVLEEPVKFNDHSMDALRYGIMGLNQMRELGDEIVVFDSMQYVRLDF